MTSLSGRCPIGMFVSAFELNRACQLPSELSRPLESASAWKDNQARVKRRHAYFHLLFNKVRNRWKPDAESQKISKNGATLANLGMLGDLLSRGFAIKPAMSPASSPLIRRRAGQRPNAPAGDSHALCRVREGHAEGEIKRARSPFDPKRASPAGTAPPAKIENARRGTRSFNVLQIACQ